MLPSTLAMMNVKPITISPIPIAMTLVRIAACLSSIARFFKGVTISINITADKEFRPELTVLIKYK